MKTKEAEAAMEAAARAIKAVMSERLMQDLKWGEQNSDPFKYLAVLMEEVGEFSREAQSCFLGVNRGQQMKAEAVQVAAVALAIVECLERDKWNWPK